MLSTFVLCAALGAAGSVQPVSPMAEPPSRCDISAVVPQFGGACVEADTLHIWLTEPSIDGDAVVATLARQCPRSLPSATPKVQVHPADYSLAQLNAWERIARSLLSRSDVALTGVNQKTNRVLVGAHTPYEDRAEILAELARAGVPEAAVEFVQATDAETKPILVPITERIPWGMAAAALAVVAGAVAILVLRRRKGDGA